VLVLLYMIAEEEGEFCFFFFLEKKKMYSGCKFSAEEERAVIELQAQFGNKWAKIATYLRGRTDNDVKNFWSTRRKRLERILQTPSPNSQKSKGKDLVFHELRIPEVKNLKTFSLGWFLGCCCLQSFIIFYRRSHLLTLLSLIFLKDKAFLNY